MLFLVESTPVGSKPSTMRDSQKAWWDWLNPLLDKGTAKNVYVKLGRGAIVIFQVDSHEDVHKLISQWSELIPATFEVKALMSREYQEKIARESLHPSKL